MRPLLTSLAVAASVLLGASAAQAQSIIKNPSMHPQGPELEPHLLLRPFRDPGDDLGLGLGFRATFQIGQNNFISKINNSVGVGVGLDWVRYHYSYCSGNRNQRVCSSGDLDYFLIPVVMQWSFYLTRSWSVFGEPGILLGWRSRGCDFGGCPRKGLGDDPGDLLTIGVGGRWHFKDTITLTMRLNWHYASVGVSFM